jgi:hypothetical protein
LAGGGDQVGGIAGYVSPLRGRGALVLRARPPGGVQPGGSEPGVGSNPGLPEAFSDLVSPTNALLPNPSLQRTRLRRGSTSRSQSQAFGLAAVRVYHRRAAELNRWAA